MRKASLNGWLWLALCGTMIMAAAGAGTARAQAPPSPETAAITSCLCLEHEMAVRSADMGAKTAARDAVQRELAGLNADLAREKPRVDVNNPDSVAHYKALLERRDAAYRQSIGPVDAAAADAVARYNAPVGQYNRDCAGHPFNAELMRQVAATLVCPPMQ